VQLRGSQFSSGASSAAPGEAGDTSPGYRPATKGNSKAPSVATPAASIWDMEDSRAQLSIHSRLGGSQRSRNGASVFHKTAPLLQPGASVSPHGSQARRRLEGSIARSVARQMAGRPLVWRGIDAHHQSLSCADAAFSATVSRKIAAIDGALLVPLSSGESGSAVRAMHRNIEKATEPLSMARLRPGSGSPVGGGGALCQTTEPFLSHLIASRRRVRSGRSLDPFESGPEPDSPPAASAGESVPGSLASSLTAATADQPDEVW